MSRFNPKQRLWIIIIALLIVVIILGSYYLFVNSDDESIELLSLDEVMNNSESYVDKTITVDGYFYPETLEGRGVITSDIIPSGSSPTNYKRLPVDYNNVNISMAEKVKYRFTGILIEEETAFGSSVVLDAKEIVQV